MCGIAGYWNVRSGRPASRAVIEAMARSLRHRGPDEEGYWLDGALALGMTRLRVVDPAGGHQPMANEDGTVQVVYNGEIYNHGDLRRELEARGHRFRTRSDTEAVVHAFEEWGPACVERFNGMFAIAAWDSRARRLFLARDRLGIKPLYLYEGPEGMVFGSELKAVVTHPAVPMAWDLEAVDDFLTYEFVPAPRSIVREVTKVLPGTWMLWREDRPGPAETGRFWRLQAGGRPATIDEAARGLRERLQRSVRRRLMADVPLGAFLSGGVDSSVIVGLMSGETPGQVRSFSLGFEDRSYNELPYAALVAERFGTTHRAELVRPEILELAERLAGYFDEPFGDVSAFPTFMISELARREVTVALSGDGGDELFGGYDHYRAHRWADRIRWLSGSAPWRLVDRLLDGLPPSSRKKGPVNKAKRFVEGLRRPADLEHARWWVFWDLAERRALYGGEAAEALAGRDCFGYYRERLAEARAAGYPGLQGQLYADVTGYLADDILVKLDRMSMAVSLEARVPFLDHEVVEYAMAIPPEWKLRGGVTKWILKRAFRDLLPPEILGRGKEGFSIPMKNWLRGPLQPMVHELLRAERVRDRGWFGPAEVARLVDEHLRGRENHAHRLWCLMSLELSLGGLERRAAERTVARQEVTR
ncbi:MAG TPA: asparagine synthase (glutamine-hydrolyzing) [Gemmatimonadales bacterium]|jgi:asparagine synthase (glutamine-hydrolysing)|nr:asparagine synthase (glutamine-hydrolyzing) [Gemmatimonadales bacterium]